MKLNTRTWPTGLIGAIRMIAKGMKVSMSRAVRRIACTSRPLSEAPVQHSKIQASLMLPLSFSPSLILFEVSFVGKE